MQTRAAIIEQVDAARGSMLQCTDDAHTTAEDVHDMCNTDPALGPLPPEAAPKNTPIVQPPRAAVPPVSILRAVSASAALADRKAALHSRLQRNAEMRRKEHLGMSARTHAQNLPSHP